MKNKSTRFFKCFNFFNIIKEHTHYTAAVHSVSCTHSTNKLYKVKDLHKYTNGGMKTALEIVLTSQFDFFKSCTKSPQQHR